MSSRRLLSGKTALVGNDNRFCRSKRPRDQSFAEEFSDIGWVAWGVVSSVCCRASLHLLGMKDNFVWAGKRTSCGGLFTVVECCSWTGNHRSVWFIFGSESGSPRRFLRINHSFKVTRKRMKCLENAFPAINFSKKIGGGLVVGFAPSALAGDGSAGRRCEDFNPVCFSASFVRLKMKRKCFIRVFREVNFCRPAYVCVRQANSILLLLNRSYFCALSIFCMILGRIVNSAGSARCGILKKIFEHPRQRAQATYMPVKPSTMNIHMLYNETR